MLIEIRKMFYQTEILSLCHLLYWLRVFLRITFLVYVVFSVQSPS